MTSPTGYSSSTRSLELIADFFRALANADIRYVHWKSNDRLDEALRGETDLDLLIDRRDVGAFESTIAALGFRRGRRAPWEEEPSVFHFFGLDPETALLVHVHVYYRVFSGGALLKNFRLPVDRLLLERPREVDGVRVPSREAELVVFVLRKMLEHTNLGELTLLSFEKDAVTRELDWLSADIEPMDCARLVREHLPSIDPDLFLASLDALKDGRSLLTRLRLGGRLRRSLARFARHGKIASSAIAYSRFTRKVLRRCAGKRSRQLLHAGGAVLAIVGPEATGKSTVGAAVGDWLGENFRVVRVHAGKPPHGVLTLLPGVLLPLLRRMLPRYRSSTVEADLDRGSSGDTSTRIHGVRGLVFALRSWMLALDRARLLERAHCRASKGVIVLCDRYPTPKPGEMDSAQVRPSMLPSGRLSLTRMLGERENRIYREMPPADIVVHLFVPVEVAVERNATRTKKGNESDEYVRRRHEQAATLEFQSAACFRVDTSGTLDDTLLEIKRLVWGVL